MFGRGCRSGRGGEVEVLTRIACSGRPRRLEHPLAGMIVPVGGDPSAAPFGACEAVPPVPAVIQRPDPGDVAVVVVAVAGATDRGHRMRVRVAHPGVRVRAYMAWNDGAHTGIVPLCDVLDSAWWGLTSTVTLSDARSRRGALRSVYFSYAYSHSRPCGIVKRNYFELSRC